MTNFFLKNSISKPVSFTLLLALLSEIVFPTAAMALTSGPSQPEVQSFEAISTSDMVDVFSGDFKYNIPLLDVEGYPINISYASGISTDQEASWVGLGWNLNVGSINRAMRGIPDDFKGDLIKKESNLRPNRTFGINAGIDFELFGKEGNKNPGTKKGKKFKLKPSVGVAINYNNYTGFGVEYSAGIGISAGVGSKGKLDAGLGLHSSAASGLDISPNISYSNRKEKADTKDESLTHVNTASGSLGGSFNTRAGLKQLSFSGGYTKSVEKTTTNVSFDPYGANGSPLTTITENVSTISSKSRSAGGTVNFGLQSYVPSINMPMVSNNVALSVKFSTHIFGVDADVRLGGYFSSQKLAEKNKDVPAYGYMYSQNGKNNRGAMLDFNREKDGSFSRTTKNLPLTNFTYDVYNVTAHGMGGTFRPFRGDVGHVFDPSSYSMSDSYSLGAELGGGNLLKGGIDLSIVDVLSTSGRWEDKNEALDYFQFQDMPTTTNRFEPYYFKQVGEMSVNPSNTTLYNSLMGDEPYGIRIQQGKGAILPANQPSAINSNLPNIRSKKMLERFNYDNTGNVALTTGNNKLTERQRRNQLFNTLSKAEAADFGLQKDLYNSSQGVLNTAPTAQQVYMKAYAAPAHHIAEVSVINQDGMRYYYGLPTYNIKNKECSFNISGNTPNSTTGLVAYDQQAASKDNERGTDYHFNMTETPAYAHSYLLTAIVSPDYVDQNNNGPDNADIGTYTKFHYTKSTSGGSNYKWRMPTANTSWVANYNENSKSNNDDNSGNYTYGEKEMWYLDEIETKNYIAKFILSNRKDGYGVADEEGNTGFSGAPSKKIEKIILYSKPEYLASLQTSAPPPVPIKTVYFEYSYELCTSIPNNNGSQVLTPSENWGTSPSNQGGKLTLRNVYFTYGKSNRAVFNKYKFYYPAAGPSNPSYNNKAYDRWGNYKPSLTADYSWSNNTLTNGEFPYVEQNQTNADLYSKAWTLERIGLPSGGEINVEYEADDYAFVQNVPAGQMFNVIGASNTQPTSTNWSAYSNLLYTNTGNNNLYLVVDLNSTAITNDPDFKKYYLKDINDGNKQLFFKFLVNLTSSSTLPYPLSTVPLNYYEYVSGYADINVTSGAAEAGLIYSGGSPTGKAWIKLKDVYLKNSRSNPSGPKINPIAMTAIQFARINYGSVIWGNPPVTNPDVEEALKNLAKAAASSLKTMLTGFKQPNKAVADAQLCREFSKSKSVVRLYTPNGKKLGGGSRVKRLYIDDKWNSMTTVGANPGQASSTYGQRYTYTDRDEYGDPISSGVASYEPMIGGEENSMKQPFYMGKNKWAVLAPDDRYYVEGPFGESFFPSPSVGYSKIKVENDIPSNASTNNKTGYKVYEFYTAKDYPTITKHTPIMPKQYRSPLKALIKIVSRDLITASQGYVVITNDMHGKAKAECDYAEGKSTPEKETRFYYKTTNGGYQQPTQRGRYTDASYSTNKLDNNCLVINKNSSVTPNLIGVDFDAIADFRESETETEMLSTQGNLASFIAALIPIVVPTIWPSRQYELSRFRSAVLTKVVNQYGILEKTSVRVDQSKVTSESLAYDAETGEGLITKTTNDFEDPVYNLKYPAYWGNHLMGSAYRNINITFAGSYVGGGIFNIYNTSHLLNIGDELAYTSGSTKMKVWVCSIPAANQVGLIDNNGNWVTSSQSISLKVVRSARRNMIGAKMSVLTSLKNPIVGSNLSVSASTEVLDAKGTKYDDNWQLPKGSTASAYACNCTATQLSYDLTYFLNNLFNYNRDGGAGVNYPYSTGYINAFLNGVGPGGGPQVNSTLVWRDAGVTIPNACPGSPGSNFICNNSGFIYTPYPFYNNHLFNPSMLSALPLAQPPCVNNSQQYVVWNGPPMASGENALFNGGANKIVGSIETCNNSCPVTIDLGNLTATQRTQVYTFMTQLCNGNGGINCNGGIFIAPSSVQNSCSNSELMVDFKLLSYFSPSNTHWVIPAKISMPCYAGLLTTNCTSPTGPVIAQCGNLPGSKVNPFATGLKGNWRTKADYTFLTDRVQTISSSATGQNTNTRKDGSYTSFTPLYSPASGNLPDGEANNWSFTTASGTNKWVNTVETSKYNQYGVEVETKDALGRYSSALYGYNEALPIAVASNAQLREIAYDGFEDYDYSPFCKKEQHFDFSVNIAQSFGFRSTQAHTGKYSIGLNNNSTSSVSRTVYNTQQAAGTSNNYCSYILSDKDFIYPFSPVSTAAGGVDYIMSYWVKETGNGWQTLNYINNQVTVTQGTGPAFATSNFKKSLIIDGWQRVEFQFKIPNNYAGLISVNLRNSSTSSGVNVFFDDIRMHPASSSMKSYVYDPVTLKYAAELDANNYATFYEYDDQGNLIRVKKETERGIMTIKESKTHYAN